ALDALSANIPVQTRFRRELPTISSHSPTTDDLNSLPYLEMMVREAMQLYAPLVPTQRMEMKDDVLPLRKPYIDKASKSHESLPIPKEQLIHIPILAVNRDTGIGGPDPPERWKNVPEAAAEIPGAWANFLTFFAGCPSPPPG
ncbi:hypothetical protein DFH09DRAFT_897386, partial [Mycena vulgaris]